MKTNQFVVNFSIGVWHMVILAICNLRTEVDMYVGSFVWLTRFTAERTAKLLIQSARR